MKKHYKLYKDGKQWTVAAITTAAVAAGIALTNANASTVHADTTPANNSDAVNQQAAVKKAVDDTASAKSQMEQDQQTNDEAQAAANKTADAKKQAQQAADKTSNDLKNAQEAQSKAQKDTDAAQKLADQATPDNINKAHNQVTDDQTKVDNAQSTVNDSQKQVNDAKDKFDGLNKTVNDDQTAIKDAQNKVDQATKAMDTKGAEDGLKKAQDSQKTAKTADDKAKQAVTDANKAVNDDSQAITNATTAKNNADDALQKAKDEAKPLDDAVKSSQDIQKSAQTSYDNAKNAYDAAVANANSSANNMNVNNAAQGVTVTLSDPAKVHEIVNKINNAKELGLDDAKVSDLVKQLVALVKINYKATDQDWNTNLNLPNHENGAKNDARNEFDRADNTTLAQNLQDEAQIFLNATMNKIIKTIGLNYGEFAPSRTVERIFWNAYDEAKVNKHQNFDGTTEMTFNTDKFDKGKVNDDVTNAGLVTAPDGYMPVLAGGAGLDGTNNGGEINNKYSNGGSGAFGMGSENDPGNVPYASMANLKYGLLDGAFILPDHADSQILQYSWAAYINWDDFTTRTDLRDKPSTVISGLGDHSKNFSYQILGGNPEFYGLPEASSDANKKVADAKTAMDNAKAALDQANNDLDQKKAAAKTADDKVKDAQSKADQAKKDLDAANDKLTKDQDALQKAQDHAAKTGADLTKANKSVEDAQKVVDESKRDQAAKQKTLDDAKKDLQDAQSKLATDQDQLKKAQDKHAALAKTLDDNKAALKKAQDQLKLAQDYYQELFAAPENLQKAKDALKNAKDDVAAKKKANDDAQAALKKATDDDDAAQNHAKETAAALKKSTDRYKMLLALQVQQERALAKDKGYHKGADGSVVDRDGNVVPGWFFDREGNLRDQDGNLIVEVAKKSAKTTSASEGMARRGNVAASNKLPQTGNDNGMTIAAMGMASIVAMLGLAGVEAKRRN